MLFMPIRTIIEVTYVNNKTIKYQNKNIQFIIHDGTKYSMTAFLNPFQVGFLTRKMQLVPTPLVVPWDHQSRNMLKNCSTLKIQYTGPPSLTLRL